MTQEATLTRNRGERRSACSRLKTRFPVNITIVSPDEGVLAWGRAVLSDISESGLRVSELRLGRGYLPLEPNFQIIIVPSEPALRDLWIKARPARIRFSDGGAELGLEIIGAARGFERLFDLVPILD